MAINLGVDGVVKTTSSVKVCRGGTIYTAPKGYAGRAGYVVQHWGTMTGISYFICYPSNVYLNSSSSASTEIKAYNLTYVSKTTSGSYTIYKYKTATYSGYYTEFYFYQLTSRSYPTNYLADYIVVQNVPTSTSTYSYNRGFWTNWHIMAVYEDDLVSSFQTVGQNIVSYHNGWLQNFHNTGISPQSYSLRTQFTTYSSTGGYNYSYPDIYLDTSSSISSWANNETKTFTSTQSSSLGTSSTRLGFGIYNTASTTAATTSMTVKFPYQYITFNGTSIPLYFSFGHLPRS